MNEMKKVDFPDSDSAPGRPVSSTKRSRLGLLMSVPLLIAAIGLYFWLTSGHSASTDNAYVKQDVTAISTQVNGPVAAVYVDENGHVNRGDPLYQVDPAP
jgi:membrane fusion protein (multidrug efflux system)